MQQPDCGPGVLSDHVSKDIDHNLREPIDDGGRVRVAGLRLDKPPHCDPRSDAVQITDRAANA